MAHFAKINDLSIVTDVIVIDNEDILDDQGKELESIGISICQGIKQGLWKQTSRSGSFRTRFAAVGYSYNEDLDAFVAPKPFTSWVFNATTKAYEAPTPRPATTMPQIYPSTHLWHEPTQSWMFDTTAIRHYRDNLLAASDHMALPDAPTGDQQAWLNYREDLRNLPQQAGFPNSITWPTKPS